MVEWPFVLLWHNVKNRFGNCAAILRALLPKNLYEIRGSGDIIKLGRRGKINCMYTGSKVIEKTVFARLSRCKPETAL